MARMFVKNWTNFQENLPIRNLQRNYRLSFCFRIVPGRITRKKRFATWLLVILVRRPMIRSVEGKESSKESLERLTICRFISVPFRCNESRQQLLATRQTCSRIREDGFPFPGSLRRHGRAAHPAARKMHKPLLTWSVSYPVYSINRTATRLALLSLSFSLNYSKPADNLPLEIKPPLPSCQWHGNLISKTVQNKERCVLNDV